MDKNTQILYMIVILMRLGREPSFDGGPPVDTSRPNPVAGSIDLRDGRA